jgi:hypothetical protein
MRSGPRAEGVLWLLAALCFWAGSGFELGDPSYTPGARAQGALRVVTWNVGGSRDGEAHGFLDEHVPAVALVLQLLEPDLVFLQECGWGSALEELDERLGPDWLALQGRGGLVLLSRAEGVERWIPPLARSIGVHLEVRGRRIAAVSIHASAFSAEARNREIGLTLDALLEQPADTHLLLGDLNIDLDLDKRRDLFSNHVQRDVESYNYVATRLVDAARGRGATAEPDRRLDYVFVSKDATVLAAGPWKGRRVGSMDHDPVVADLLIR